MVRRWVEAGMLEAQRGFCRIKGCKDMPLLVAAVRKGGHIGGCGECHWPQVRSASSLNRSGTVTQSHNGRDILANP
jgi:hypothetical protein